VPDVDPYRNPKATYLQVAEAITERIQGGEITYKLPAERALAAEYGVAYQTVRRSMKLLRDRGLIITRQGRGTFVAAAVLGDEDDGGPGAGSPSSGDNSKTS
jgi:GntR family transcriptional regulator